MKKSYISAIVILACAAVIGGIAGSSFYKKRHFVEDIVTGEHVTEVRMLSDYNPNLKGTAGDTEIYVLKGAEEGGSLLVLGSTHANEPAGHMAGIVLEENANVKVGTIYVIPSIGHSGLTHNDPLDGSPQYLHYTTPSGELRTFHFGSRASNPIDQWPDSDVYVHRTSGQTLSGSETRNLNRAYPGSNSGTFTERVTYGITELVKQRDVKITVDLHEASPEYTTVNAIVAHQDAIELASWASMDMQMEGMNISIEASPTNLHGLSHRELGDFTDTLATLMETANPSQGRLRGRTNADLVVKGVDKYYVRARKAGSVTVEFTEAGIPLDERVARHICGIVQLCNAYNELGNQETIELGGLPSYQEILTNGIGRYLSPGK